jgi:hypothetical protein
MEDSKGVLAKVVQLRTQLVSQGHARHLLAETGLMSLRIHCYAPVSRKRAALAYQGGSHLRGDGRHRTIQHGQGRQDGRKSEQASSRRTARRLLLSVPQLGRDSPRNGAHRRWSGQVGHASQPRWHADPRKSSRARRRETRSDRRGIF